MEIMFRMTNGLVIRDASGRYACPNVICWSEYQTGHKPPENASIYDDTRYTKCPTCGVALDWGWVIEK